MVAPPPPPPTTVFGYEWVVIYSINKILLSDLFTELLSINL